MATSRKKPVKHKEMQAVETDPGAWERFEHAVDAAVKSGPKHRKTQPAKRRKADGRVGKKVIKG